MCTNGKQIFLKLSFRRNIKQWFALHFLCPFFSSSGWENDSASLPPPAWVRGRERGGGGGACSCFFHPNEKASVDGGGETDTEEEVGNEFSFLAMWHARRPTLPYCIVLSHPPPLHFLQCLAFISYKHWWMHAG